jgi:hypothetical protein
MVGHKEDQFYHYQIAVLKNGKAIESFAINLDSSILLTKGGSYLFDINKLKNLIGKVKPLVRKEHKFTSYMSGKAYEADIQKNQNFLFASEWDWQNYEGSFIFYYKGEDDIDKVIKQLEKSILSTYPRESFKIDIFMAAPHGELGFKLACNKSLYDQFKLRKDSWKPLDFYLTTYWKQ